MLKKIVLFIYIIIIGIAITIIILSNSVTETGIIAINNNALVTVDNNLLKPKIVAGDLVIVDITTKKVKEDDIISYVTLDEDKTIIRTNKIVATTKDENNNKSDTFPYDCPNWKAGFNRIQFYEFLHKNKLMFQSHRAFE